MKTYVVLYRLERGGNVQHLINQYESKKAVRDELRGNGLITLAVLTEQDVKTIKEKQYYDVREVYEDYVRQLL
jgi:uncharacterized protein with GYD domain